MVPTEVLMTFFPSSTLKKYAIELLFPCPQGIRQLTRLSMGAQWAVQPLSGFSKSTTSIHSLFSFFPPPPSSPPMFNIFPHEREKTCTLQRVRDYLFIQLSPSPPIIVVSQWESVIHCRKNSSLCAEHAAVSFIHCTEREIERKRHFVLLEGPW